MAAEAAAGLTEVLRLMTVAVWHEVVAYAARQADDCTGSSTCMEGGIGAEVAAWEGSGKEGGAAAAATRCQALLREACSQGLLVGLLAAA